MSQSDATSPGRTSRPALGVTSSTSPSDGTPRQNKLLAALPEDRYQELRDELEIVSLAARDVVYEADAPIHHVYFPLTAVVSLMITMLDRSSVEFASVGNEGVVGVAVFLGAESMPGRAITQVPGTAARLPARALAAALSAGTPLDALLRRYTQALLGHVAQSAACNRLHPVHERCARWLLTMHDRAQVDQFTLTQHFLAQMLGVRRATVTVAAGQLQEAGLIRYTRGKLTIFDRAGLEVASCECYARIRRQYDRLLGTLG